MIKNSTNHGKLLYSLIVYAVWVPIFLTASCSSSLSSDTKIRVRILGSPTQPTGATGTKSPMAQIYLFNNLSLQPSDGSAAVDLYDADPLELRVISRPQEVWSTTDLTDYEGVEFNSATISFDPAVLVVDQDSEEHTINLDTGDLAMSEAFTVTAGHETVITIKASWGKTVTPIDDTTPDTTVSAPSFTLFLGESE